MAIIKCPLGLYETVEVAYGHYCEAASVPENTNGKPVENICKGCMYNHYDDKAWDRYLTQTYGA